jgi:acyl-CoA synthetase (AMP-forming)/AMP-acid ligase II
MSARSQPSMLSTDRAGTGSMPDVPTLVDMLRFRAASEPDRLAFTVLADGDADDETISYGELDRRARSIAARLQAEYRVGDRILLPLPTSLEYVAAFFGCLYAGMVAVPAYPPRRNQSFDRIESIVTNARPAAALVTSESLPALAGLAAETPGFEGLHWLAVDDLQSATASAWRPPTVTPETLAFLQYTSGSTRTPRGVMVSHRNILHNSAISAHMFQLSRADVGVTWLPLYHDFGLIGGMLQPVCTGLPVVLISPLAFLLRPMRWLRAISQYGATLSGSPPFALDLCVRRSRPEEREGLDLSTWKALAIGGEPIRQDVLDRFVTAFEPYGFRREALCTGYGLAEATLFFSATSPGASPSITTVDPGALEQHRVVALSPGHPDGKPFVGCGQSMAEQRLAIVNPESNERCVEDEVGEIWIAGASIAGGYWDRPDESTAVFGAYLSDGDGPYLKTGDLGFVHDGELYISGRLKDLIIIRGRNHYPQDVEWTVHQSHPALADVAGAAFTIDREGEERLVVAHEVGRAWLRGPSSEIHWSIRRTVAEAHDLEIEDIVLLLPGSLPRTSSGKVRRRASRDALLAGTLKTWAGPSAEVSSAVGEHHQHAV